MYIFLYINISSLDCTCVRLLAVFFEGLSCYVLCGYWDTREQPRRVILVQSHLWWRKEHHISLSLACLPLTWSTSSGERRPLSTPCGAGNAVDVLVLFGVVCKVPMLFSSQNHETEVFHMCGIYHIHTESWYSSSNSTKESFQCSMCASSENLTPSSSFWK